MTSPKLRIVHRPQDPWPYDVEAKGWFFWHLVAGFEYEDQARKRVRELSAGALVCRWSKRIGTVIHTS